MVATLGQLRSALANEGFEMVRTLDEITDYPAMLIDYASGGSALDTGQFEDQALLIAFIAPRNEFPDDEMKDGVRLWMRGKRASVADLRAEPGAPDMSEASGFSAIRHALGLVPAGAPVEIDEQAIPDTLRGKDFVDPDENDYPLSAAYALTVRML